MKIFRYGELLTAPRGGVFAIGFFDGVHSAHRRLLSEALKEARGSGSPFGIITFSSESEIKKASPRLYSTKERIEIFERLGADFTVLLDFEEIRDLSAEDFVKKILIDGLGATVAYAGFNFKFGKGAKGDADELSRLMKEQGARAVIFDEITEDGITVSATLIRSLIEDGQIGRANSLLGAPYSLRGEVVRGNGKGHTLGFPTVNTTLPENKVKPKRGVYRSIVALDEKTYLGVTNVGVCPTFEIREIHPETFIIDFTGDVYGKSVTVYLLGYLREEREFDSPEDLKMQIEVDINRTIKENGEEKWQVLGLK